jgi:D-alanine-D-alanine ligase
MKVAVLMGGASFERETSLASGKVVCEALEEAGHKVVPLDTTKELVPTLRGERPDICYIALHGKHGEDGTIQSLLDFLDIPYVGSPAEVCRNTFNKALLPASVQKFRRYAGESGPGWWPQGFCLAGDVFKDMGAATAFDLVAERIPGGYPVCVKPARGGSAHGVHKVENQEALGAAILDALTFDDEVIIEQWIEGIELSVAILGNGWDATALPPVEIVSRSGLFLTEERLSEDAVDYYTPVRLDSLHTDQALAQSIRSEIERAAIEVYQAFNVQDLGRVDLIWDGAQARILEVDVSPGMTTHSLFPMACKAAGLSLPAVLDRLVTRAR